MPISKKFWKIEPFSSNASNMYIDTYPRPDPRKYHCIFCEQESTQLVYYKMEGAVVLQKYCDECVKKIKVPIASSLT